MSARTRARGGRARAGRGDADRLADREHDGGAGQRAGEQARAVGVARRVQQAGRGQGRAAGDRERGRRQEQTAREEERRRRTGRGLSAAPGPGDHRAGGWPNPSSRRTRKPRLPQRWLPATGAAHRPHPGRSRRRPRGPTLRRSTRPRRAARSARHRLRATGGRRGDSRAHALRPPRPRTEADAQPRGPTGAPVGCPKGQPGLCGVTGVERGRPSPRADRQCSLRACAQVVAVLVAPLGEGDDHIGERPAERG